MLQEFDHEYQLLCDVVTRWSSTLLMINQILKLKNVSLIFNIQYLLIYMQAIDDITRDYEFKDLFKF